MKEDIVILLNGRVQIRKQINVDPNIWSNARALKKE